MKKLSITIASLLLLLLIISSCGSMTIVSKKKLMDIQQGMTQQEIKALLGSPDYRRFGEMFEEWEYQRLDESLNWAVVLVFFTDGLVTGMDTFQSPTPPSPVTHPVQNTTVVVTPSPSRPHSPGNEVPHRRREVMSQPNFDKFHQSLKRGFSWDYMKTIENALQTTRFTSAQCQVLLKLFSFSDEQVGFLKAVYPGVSDKQNFYTVVDKLSFGTDKTRINDYIENYNKRR